MSIYTNELWDPATCRALHRQVERLSYGSEKLTSIYLGLWKRHRHGFPVNINSKGSGIVQFLAAGPTKATPNGYRADPDDCLLVLTRDSLQEKGLLKNHSEKAKKDVESAALKNIKKGWMAIYFERAERELNKFVKTPFSKAALKRSKILGQMSVKAWKRLLRSNEISFLTASVALTAFNFDLEMSEGSSLIWHRIREVARNPQHSEHEIAKRLVQLVLEENVQKLHNRCSKNNIAEALAAGAAPNCLDIKTVCHMEEIAKGQMNGILAQCWYEKQQKEALEVLRQLLNAGYKPRDPKVMAALM